MNIRLVVISLLVSIFFDLSFIALSVLLSAGSPLGHSGSVFGAFLEMTFFTAGLLIIIPAVILFLILRSYEKKNARSGKKSYTTLYIIILFIVTTVLFVVAENSIRNSNTEGVRILNKAIEEQIKLDQLTTNTKDVLVCEKMIQDSANYYATQDCYTSACKDIVDPNSRKSCFAPICEQIKINDLKRGAQYIDPEWNRECEFGLQYEKI